MIIGLIWTWMLDFNLGVLNEIGVQSGHLWRTRSPGSRSPDTALAAVILAVVWQGFPFFAVTLLAGLQAIPAELYEAASIDGAGAWRKFRHVTLPGLAGGDRDGAAAAHDLGRELARPDPGDDRRRAGHGHADAAAATRSSPPGRAANYG